MKMLLSWVRFQPRKVQAGPNSAKHSAKIIGWACFQLNHGFDPKSALSGYFCSFALILAEVLAT